MLVLFQIFLMMALSSSLACSKLPGGKGQAGAALGSSRPSRVHMAKHPGLSEPLRQHTAAAMPGTAMEEDVAVPRGQPTPRARGSLSLGLGSQCPEQVALKAVLPCSSPAPHRSLRIPHAHGLSRGPQAASLWL